jgi:hypothetical protein
MLKFFVFVLLALSIQIKSLNVEMVAQLFRHGHRYSVFNFFNSKT